jgi:CRP/FNR family transcriptional regulator, cyclic AMP receptor protein
MTLNVDLRNHPQTLAILVSFGWLAHVPAPFRDAVLQAGRLERVEAGETLTTAGDDVRELIGIADGVAAVTPDAGLPETPVMHLLRAPFWLGYGVLVGEPRRRVTATMRTPGWILRVPWHKIAGTFTKDPAAWRLLLPLVFRYGDTATAVAADLLVRGSERRVVAILTRMSGHRSPEDGPPLARIPLTQAEIAAAANMSRNTALTVLRRLADRDLIEIRRTNIVLRDPAALVAMLS